MASYRAADYIAIYSIQLTLNEQLPPQKKTKTNKQRQNKNKQTDKEKKPKQRNYSFKLECMFVCVNDRFGSQTQNEESWKVYFEALQRTSMS